MQGRPLLRGWAAAAGPPWTAAALLRWQPRLLLLQLQQQQPRCLQQPLCLPQMLGQPLRLPPTGG